LRDTRPAKLSFAGVAGFEGGLNAEEAAGLARAPDCCEARPARGVERPESCGVGPWRYEGKAAGILEGFLAGADQSRPARSSIV
jgi:hypothetical protein